MIGRVQFSVRRLLGKKAENHENRDFASCSLLDPGSGLFWMPSRYIAIKLTESLIAIYVYLNIFR